MQTEIIAVEACRKCLFVRKNTTKIASCGHPKLLGSTEPEKRIVTYGKGFDKKCPLLGVKYRRVLEGKVQVVYLRRDEDKLFKKRYASFSATPYGI